MPFVVCKFGGTSLCSGEMFLKVCSIVKRDPRRRIVVVSAPGKRSRTDSKITDLLISLSENKSERLLDAVTERFSEIAAKTNVSIEKQLCEIKDKVLSGARKEYVISRGEWLSGIIMAKCLGFHFLDAKDAISFSENEVLEKTYEAIRSAFIRYNGLVIPGFYGTDEKGNIRLFPRGGSDITGAIAAKAIGADLYENWTDVDGVYDKDPAKHTDAKMLSYLSYSGMRRLCGEGACVLHPESLLPVMEAGIPVRVRNTNHLSQIGTLIHA